ncbi:MAG TPA: HEAT repeat domain-containing protein, partial [Burkholderiales bacterium]|nr:HEAT repeat domain-containing protein [Burkholderiales bacterium]
DLLRIAKNDNVARETRKSAIFWVGQEVAEEATRHLKDVVTDRGDLEVRKSAIFALSQQRTGDAVGALIEIARTNPEKELRKSAFFWLGQSDDPRVMAMFEDILLRN